MFDLLDVLLVQRDFLQGQDVAVVVLGPAADHVLCDWTDETHKDRPTSVSAHFTYWFLVQNQFKMDSESKRRHYFSGVCQSESTKTSTVTEVLHYSTKLR